MERKPPKNLQTLVDDQLYSIKELSRITDCVDNTIRNRIQRYRPERVIEDGLVKFAGSVAKDFLAHRKSGRKI